MGMSRNIIRTKNIMTLFSLLLVVSLIINQWLLAALFLSLLVLFSFNLLIVRKMSKQIESFASHSQIRNINFLIIGDMCDVKKLVQSDSYIQISAPGRSLKASFEVLRHTFSILKAHEGTVIIVTQKDNTEGYSVFDVPYFNKITINRLHLESLILASKMSLFTAPIRSIKFFLGIYTTRLSDATCPLKEVINFCEERNINLVFKQLQ